MPAVGPDDVREPLLLRRVLRPDPRARRARGDRPAGVPTSPTAARARGRPRGWRCRRTPRRGRRAPSPTSDRPPARSRSRPRPRPIWPRRARAMRAAPTSGAAPDGHRVAPELAPRHHVDRRPHQRGLDDAPVLERLASGRRAGSRAAASTGPRSPTARTASGASPPARSLRPGSVARSRRSWRARSARLRSRGVRTGSVRPGRAITRARRGGGRRRGSGRSPRDRGPLAARRSR